MSTFNMQQLEQLTGVSARTLRHWIARKLVPKPVGRGRAARYEQAHVSRARAISALRHRGEPLSAIRGQLATASEAELAALQMSAEPVAATALPAAPALPSSAAPPFRSWDVATLMPGLVLLVQADDLASKAVAAAICRAYGLVQ